jgi:hypothetical protein
MVDHLLDYVNILRLLEIINVNKVKLVVERN